MALSTRTLTAKDAARWLARLNEIHTALKMAEDINGIVHSQWLQVWRAKAATACIQDDLLRLTCADVAVESEVA